MQPLSAHRPTARPSRILDPISRVMLSPHLALVALMAALGTVLFGALAPGQSLSSWPDLLLVGARGAEGVATPITSLFASHAFRGLMALCAGVGLVRLLHGAMPGWSLPCEPGSTHEDMTLPGDTDSAWQLVERAMAVAGQRISHGPASGEIELAVARRAGGALGSTLSAVGLVLLFLGAVIWQRSGWQSRVIALTVGQKADLGVAGQIRLDQLSVWPSPDTMGERVGSEVTIERGTQVVVEPLELAAPARVDGFTYYQLGHGPAVRVSARQGEQELPVRAVGSNATDGAVRVAFAGSQDERLVILPTAGAVVRITHYGAAPAAPSSKARAQAPAMHIQLLDGSGGQVLAEAFLSGSGVISTGDLTVAIDPEFYVDIVAQREPGVRLLALGGGLLLAGAAMMIAFPQRRCRIALVPVADGTRVRLIARAADGEASWFICALAILKADSRG